MNCNIKDTLLRFNIDNDNNNKNKIASSIMAKPNNQRTKEENQQLTISIIQEMVRKENNKIGSSAVTPSTNKGEVAELQSLFNLHYR